MPPHIGLRSLALVLAVGTVACDILPPEPPEDVHPDNLRDDSPAALLRGGSTLVVFALVVAVAALVLGALGYLPATRMRSREVVEQLE
jgi:hypothetical protein